MSRPRPTRKSFIRWLIRICWSCPIHGEAPARVSCSNRSSVKECEHSHLKQLALALPISDIMSSETTPTPHTQLVTTTHPSVTFRRGASWPRGSGQHPFTGPTGPVEYGRIEYGELPTKPAVFVITLYCTAIRCRPIFR